ncbi:MAG: hypothetical protein ACRDZO_22960 [Egibacteraceae bacterium]
MEINDYLRAIKQRMHLTILLPLTAVALVVAVQSIRSQEYRATATVAVPAIISGDSQYTGATASRTFVADLVAMIESPTIVTRVAEATGVPASRLHKGISADAVGPAASLVEVTYRTQHPEEAEPVARAVAGEAIAFLFEGSAEIAQQRVEEAQVALDEAQYEINAFTLRTDLLIPDRDFDTTVAQLSTLELEEITARAAGESGKAATIRSAIELKKEELKELAPQVQAYTPLATRRTEASAQLEAARQQLGEARAKVEAGKSGKVVTASVVRPIPKIHDIASKGAAALGAGLFLAAALAIWLGSDRGQRSENLVGTSSGASFRLDGWITRMRQAFKPAERKSADPPSTPEPTPSEPEDDRASVR